MHIPKRKWIILLAVSVVLLCVAAMVTCQAMYNASNISLSVLGEQEVVLRYGEAYAEEGAEAVFSCAFLRQTEKQVNVTVDGEPDLQKVGNYYIKYTATYGPFCSTGYRLVRVQDQDAPVISLVSDPDAYTLPNAEYEEEGFSAWDEYDGDITHKVRRSAGREYVTYTVTDSSGNTATVQRQIKYADPIPPKITMKGNKSITLFLGQEYFEPGYSAEDNVDGDLSDNVEISGGVNVSNPGQYTITYTVADSFNNVAKVTREIRVMPFNSEMVFAEDYAPNGKVIYLTFDDGPSSHTPRLLDVLKKYNIKATFFVVNTGYIDTIKRAAEEGHTIAIHSTSHKFKSVYASEEAYFQDLEQMQNIIENLTGQKPMILRFPGGSSNTVSKFNAGIMTRLVQAVTEKGYRYFDWNVDSNDAGGAKTANTVFNNVIKGVSKRDVSVVLQHDIKGFSVDAVEKIILWGLVNGYRFEALTMDSPVCAHNIKN